ncbi:uncharacterized protein FIBRA_07854 [Fibroporia radiculosa]|uniref:Uncharacterized protein n=1 Tax=Fibroporia radiculosa TaxID=599839 RepID=J4GVR0_9APHY|nr:uncharacterized protein FIBRA_07854 [Fibroporia radiculosa]CCM05625.1 predicted protein [Fibroporia radiculosa]
MTPFATRFLSLCLLVALFSLARATLYVTEPVSSTTCYGGQTCTVTWLDDGAAPLLAEIGACYVGLYSTDKNVLVQQIEPVNVASVHSLEFIPDPSAGPNTSNYYIMFTSVELANYTQYSADFTLKSMSGIFAIPVPSDTSAIPVPTAVLNPPIDSIIPATTVIDVFSSVLAVSSPSSTVTTKSTTFSTTAVVPSSGLTTSRVSSSTSSVTPPILPSPSAMQSAAERSLAVMIPLYPLPFALDEDSEGGMGDDSSVIDHLAAQWEMEVSVYCFPKYRCEYRIPGSPAKVPNVHVGPGPRHYALLPCAPRMRASSPSNLVKITCDRKVLLFPLRAHLTKLPKIASPAVIPAAMPTMVPGDMEGPDPGASMDGWGLEML